MTPVSYVLCCILGLLLAGGVIVASLTGLNALTAHARRRRMRRELAGDWVAVLRARLPQLCEPQPERATRTAARTLTGRRASGQAPAGGQPRTFR